MPRDTDQDGGGMDMSALLPTLTLMMSNRGGGSSETPYIQLLMAILLPMLLRLVLPKLQRAFSGGLRIKTYATRSISHMRDTSTWRWWDEADDEDTFNVVVHKAVLQFINKELPHVAKGWMNSDIQALKEDRTLEGSCATPSDSSCSDDSETNNSATSCISATYTHYSYLCAPPEATWVDLHNGIEMERTVESAKNSGSAGEGRTGRQMTTTFTLRSACTRNGPQQLNAFIDKCVDMYNEELRSKVDSSRYLYTPVLSAVAEGASEKNKACMLYKQYKLSEAWTFASFFHPQKESILALVDQFMAKKGKFSIPGYPVKLGFLLHGPPGTGKTSFIKALAQYTNRHIVNIPLSKIKTNQELMNIMFDQKILLSGSEDGTASAPLPHSRVIFVMEDVDAASSVVHRRVPAAASGMPSSSLAPAGPSAASLPASEAMLVAAAMAASTNSNLAGGSGGGKTPSSCGAVSSTPSSSSLSGAPPRFGEGGASGPFDAGVGGVSTSTTGPLGLQEFLKDSAIQNDKLNLASLLNVLDGVVDTPDRIIIMTSNHPEKLDPALIRPGRINRKLYLGNVQLLQATYMMRHYFSGGMPMASEAEQKLASIFVDDVLSPAQVESMCAEYETADGLIDGLAATLAAAAGGTTLNAGHSERAVTCSTA